VNDLRNALPLLLAATLAATVGACTVVPAPIVAPPGYLASRGPTFTWSVGYAAARARIVDGQGQTRDIAGNGAAAWGDSDNELLPFELLAPSMVSAHFAETTLDGGAYLGWRRLGGVGRVRLLALPSGALTSATASANVHWSGVGADVSGGLEQIVPFQRWASGLFRLGVGVGRRNFDIQVPTDLDAYYQRPGGGYGNAHLDVTRDDVRLEGALGLVWLERFTLTAQPFFVVARGGTRDVHCSDCTAGVQLVDFEQSFGLAFAFTVVAR
jgi:hypothetical protein